MRVSRGNNEMQRGESNNAGSSQSPPTLPCCERVSRTMPAVHPISTNTTSPSLSSRYWGFCKCVGGRVGSCPTQRQAGAEASPTLIHHIAHEHHQAMIFACARSASLYLLDHYARITTLTLGPLASLKIDAIWLANPYLKSIASSIHSHNHDSPSPPLRAFHRTHTGRTPQQQPCPAARSQPLHQPHQQPQHAGEEDGE